jgi:hypothetical protein
VTLFGIKARQATQLVCNIPSTIKTELLEKLQLAKNKSYCVIVIVLHVLTIDAGISDLLHIQTAAIINYTGIYNNALKITYANLAFMLRLPVSYVSILKIY